MQGGGNETEEFGSFQGSGHVRQVVPSIVDLTARMKVVR